METTTEDTRPAAFRLPAIVSLLLVAFVVRLIVLLWLEPRMMLGDEYHYWRLARKALAGTYQERFFLPLWPHLMAIALWVWDSALSVRLLSVVIGSVNVALLYHVGRRVMDSRTAYLAAMAYAFYPEHVLYSHLMYAELPLELFILGALAVYFGRWPMMPRPSRAATAFLVLGVGTLCKHFTVIAWVGLAWIHVSRSPARWRAAAVAAVYLVPAALFSLWAGVRTGDPLALINTPIKSAVEWRTGAPGGKFSPARRAELVEEGIAKAKGRSLGSKVGLAGRNFANLWTPNSYPSLRFHSRYYSAGRFPVAAQVVGICHVALLILGLAGLVSAPKGPFRTYALASLALLSAMSAGWLMVSRYRVPALHVLVLYAAFGATHRIYARNAFKNPLRIAAAAALAVAALLICWFRWGTIGSWP